ncbi:ABC transporter permease [Kutzneria buriramensis]|uniref:NitT/TauT family transport system permease protein n=1 Tax=Kutzneria buriramensis TaxID=1045776 RepID=A0A3E0GY48_9PSEU|nr:ABC transporter permease subunit [Kutzneria buriramensis]REH32459.1 NitT/TauT family transport system permease protein [Kutzneria buriramensis]
MPFVRKLAGLVGFLLLWEAAGRLGLVDARVLPPPSEVLVRFGLLFTDRGFVAGAVSTVLSWAIALLCATVLGVGVGLLLGSVPALRLITMPVIEFLRPLPSVALIPLAIALLGTQAQTKIVLGVFAATWPILLNTSYALGEVDPRLLETVRCFRVSRWRRLVGVTLPSIGPFVLTGVRISASIALIAIVGTEFLAGGSIGLGQYAFVQGTSGGRMDVVLAATVFAGLFGCLVNAGFLAVQRRWVSWGSVASSSGEVAA